MYRNKNKLLLAGLLSSFVSVKAAPDLVSADSQANELATLLPAPSRAKVNFLASEESALDLNAIDKSLANVSAQLGLDESEARQALEKTSSEELAALLRNFNEQKAALEDEEVIDINTLPKVEYVPGKPGKTRLVREDEVIEDKTEKVSKKVSFADKVEFVDTDANTEYLPFAEKLQEAAAQQTQADSDLDLSNFMIKQYSYPSYTMSSPQYLNSDLDTLLMFVISNIFSVQNSLFSILDSMLFNQSMMFDNFPITSFSNPFMMTSFSSPFYKTYTSSYSWII